MKGSSVCTKIISILSKRLQAEVKQAFSRSLTECENNIQSTSSKGFGVSREKKHTSVIQRYQENIQVVVTIINTSGWFTTSQIYCSAGTD